MCTICDRLDRTTIENALISMLPSMTIEDIANRFDVDVEELKMHALFHTPLVSLDDLSDSENKHNSLVRSMKLKEADMLAEVSAEYLVTLKAMGRHINSLLDVSESAIDRKVKVSTLLTKPMVEMYIGLGSEIRQTVKTAAEIDRMLNGPKDGATAGLQALAEAIRGSASTND